MFKEDDEIIRYGDKVLYKDVVYFYLDVYHGEVVLGNKFLRPMIGLPLKEMDNIKKLVGEDDE